MSPKEVLAELTYPVRSLTPALALLVFALLIALASRAGLLGLWLLIVVVPAMFRFLVMLAEARAAGRDVEPPGIEFFTLGGNLWTLFPAVLVLALAFLLGQLAQQPRAAWALALAAACVLPAVLSVLVITHSPLQAINPVALGRLVRQLGPTYALGPVVLLAMLAAGWLAATTLPAFAGFAELYLLFAFHALAGATLREHGLIDDIDIPEDAALRLAGDEAKLARERRVCLDHAYGLFSRGNRAGALAYLGKWLENEPDPGTARAWFLEQMLKWEKSWPAMDFGQDYLGWLLARNETVRAVKLMLRLRLVDDGFRPAACDREAALAAARATGNAELAQALGS